MWIRNDKNLKYTENPKTLNEYIDNRNLEELYREQLARKANRKANLKKWLSPNIVGIIAIIVTIILFLYEHLR